MNVEVLLSDHKAQLSLQRQIRATATPDAFKGSWMLLFSSKVSYAGQVSAAFPAVTALKGLREEPVSKQVHNDHQDLFKEVSFSGSVVFCAGAEQSGES